MTEDRKRDPNDPALEIVDVVPDGDKLPEGTGVTITDEQIRRWFREERPIKPNAPFNNTIH